VLELQATARVKDHPDAHRDVRVLPSLSNTQSSSPSAFEYAPLKRCRSYTGARRRFAMFRKPFELWHTRGLFSSPSCTRRDKRRNND
jgi:hypothetical protein